MIKTFIDTNIFLDILCKREKFVDDALSIFDMAIDNQIELLISDLSIANIKYITRKEIPIDKFYDLIKTFRPIFTIVPLGADVIDKALDLRANDFEDALQYFSAVQANADCLVTRNIKDYGFAKMEVLNSQTFLAKYK
ncbi:MAG: PIN domain-containing protein [Prevotella sp.]|jgi:predicted nucleic acid-binding protein|nr:PIN domain-containing protein [Prevotella sp.]MBR6828287.1 PIN domain-containing protein [Prevotella sp.]